MIEQSSKYWGFSRAPRINYNIAFQEPFRILESVIDVSSSHENIEQTRRKDVLHADDNAEGH